MSFQWFKLLYLLAAPAGLASPRSVRFLGDAIDLVVESFVWLVALEIVSVFATFPVLRVVVIPIVGAVHRIGLGPSRGIVSRIAAGVVGVISVIDHIRAAQLDIVHRFNDWVVFYVWIVSADIGQGCIFVKFAQFILVNGFVGQWPGESRGHSEDE